jgi:hypothetical protein
VIPVDGVLQLEQRFQVLKIIMMMNLKTRDVRARQMHAHMSPPQPPSPPPRPYALRIVLIVAALLAHATLAEFSLSRFFSSGHAPSLIGSIDCAPLAPSAGAVAYWPLTSSAHERPPANPGGIEAVWRAELCAGDARALFSAGMQHNSEKYTARLPVGTRVRCVGPSCHGALVVERVAGCPVAPACRSGRARPADCAGPHFAEPPPAAAEEDAWDLGPDELFVIIEGAEFLRPRGVHVGGCRYIFPFDMALPGAYRIFALALRSDWQALNETGATTTNVPYPAGMAGYDWPFRDPGGDGADRAARLLHHDPGHPWELSRFPPYTLDNILGEKCMVHFGGPGAGSMLAEEARAAARADAAECSGADALPVCDTVAPPGRWVRTTSIVHDFDADAPTWIEETGKGRQFESPHAGLGIRYFSPIRDSVAWTPYTCCRKPLVSSRVAACMSNTSVVFRGDSQMRDLFNMFITTACGNQEKAVTHGDDLCTHTEIRCPGWHACYRWDALGEDLPMDHSDPMCLQPNYAQNSGHFHDPRCETPAWVVPPGPESAVVNFGQWSSSGGRQNSLALWALEVARYAEIASHAQSPRVFWLELSPFPMGNFEFFYKYRDWRTTHRLELFHAISMRTLAPLAAKGRIAGYIPRWDVINPIVDATAADAAHPSHPDMLLTTSERIISALCGTAVMTG